MIVTGSGIARSRTTSKGSPRPSFATHAAEISRARASQTRMRRGVKPRFTIARMTSWRGGSEVIRFGVRWSAKGLMPVRATNSATARSWRQRGPRASVLLSMVSIAREEKRSGWRSTKTASSWRETQKQAASGAQCTGSCSRSAR